MDCCVECSFRELPIHIPRKVLDVSRHMSTCERKVELDDGSAGTVIYLHGSGCTEHDLKIIRSELDRWLPEFRAITPFA